MHAFAPPERPPSSNPLGMAVGENHGLEELLLAERADQEMGGAIGMELLQRAAIGARKQDKQGSGIRLDRICLLYTSPSPRD